MLLLKNLKLLNANKRFFLRQNDKSGKKFCVKKGIKRYKSKEQASHSFHR